MGADAFDAAERNRIMLVIPGRIFRHGIELVLRGAGGQVVYNCETLEQAETALRDQVALKPDLFVVGMDTPARAPEDFAQIRAMRERSPDARWIVLGSYGGPEFWWQAVESRIDGLLHQDSPAEVLQVLVKLILLGYSFLPSSPYMVTPGDLKPGQHPGVPPLPDPTIGAMFPMPEPRPASERAPGVPWRAGLSQRESDILRGLVAGQSNKQIARDLTISEATVKVHVKALLRKMQVTNRTQAAISALQHMNKPAPTAAVAQPDKVDQPNDKS